MMNRVEPIEAVMWRTMKILRVFHVAVVLQHIVMTHECTQKRLTRYVNLLRKHGFVHEHGRGRYQISSSAPAQAPIFRKGFKV